MTFRRSLAFLPLLALSASPLRAQTVNWTGASGGFWDVGTNWSPGGAPNGTTIDVVNATGNRFVYRSGATTVRSVQTNAELELTGGVLELLSNLTFNAGGSLKMNGGTLKGATLADTSLVTFSTATSVFDNVTLGAGQGLNVVGAAGTGYLQVRNGLTFSGNPTFNLGDATRSGILDFDTKGLPGASLVFDNATVNFGTGGGNYLAFGTSDGAPGATTTLTLGAGLNLQGKSGTLGVYYGLFSANRTLNVNANLISDEGGIWNIGDGQTVITNNATIRAASVAGSSANVDATTLTNSAGANIENARTSGTSSVGANILNNAGTIQATASGATLTIGFTGSAGTRTLNNTGTIQATNGARVTIANPTILTSLGTVRATGAGSSIGLNVNLSSLAPWSGVSVSSSGRIDYGGTFANPGAFSIASVTGEGNANGLLQLNNGAIVGGTLTDASQLRFINGNANILDGVTLGAGQGLNVLPASGSGSYVQIKNGLTFSGNPTFALGDSSNVGVLEFNSTNYVFDNATVNFGNVGSALTFGSGSATAGLTLGSGLNVQGKIASFGTNYYLGGAKTLTNNATLLSDEGGNWSIDLFGGTLQNNGTIRAATAAGSIFVVNATTLTNAAGANIENARASNSAINVNALGNAGTIQATASGASLAINPTGASATQALSNTGTIRATNGGSVTFNAGSGVVLANAGAIQVGAGSAITSNNPLTNGAGGTIVSDGTLAMGANTLTLTGGTLSGTGAVTFTGAGKLVNSGGVVSPGNSPGTLSLVGGYQQSGAGSLLMEIGGTGAGQFDVLSITGAASLGGTLELQPVAGFVFSAGQSFDLMTASAGITGSFATVHTPGLVPGLQASFSVVPGAGGDVGRVLFSAVAIPEPGSLALLGIGGAFILGLRRRRR